MLCRARSARTAGCHDSAGGDQVHEARSGLGDPTGACQQGCGTTVKTDQRGVHRPQGSGCDIAATGDTIPGNDTKTTRVKVT
jgi:hypothetical protein